MHRILVLTLLVPACGGDKPPPEPSFAKALDHVLEGQEATKAKTDDKAIEKMREKAAKEAEDARHAEFDKLVTVPAEGVGDRKANCKAAADAYDAFKTARLQGNEVALGRWTAIKGRDLEHMVETCNKEKPEVAACKANALKNAPAEFAEGAAEKLIVACEDKFGDGEKKAE